MNPHASRSISPKTLLHSIVSNRDLVQSLIRREVVGRYRGSMMGLLWSYFNPVLMLTVYTFVFSVVFKARWTGGSESKTEFALVLFAGLMVFNLFAECVSRAPTLILQNTNYVKKVIFPLEVLPVITLGSALFHFAVSLLVWLLFFVVFRGLPPATAAWLPVVVAPLILSTLGVSWLLASLGAYLRDVGQIVSVLITILMFLSPVFYPVSSLPAQYQTIMNLNPLTFVVEQAREVMIFGHGMAIEPWIVQMTGSALLAWLGFAWFQKTRKGFADVL